MPIKVNIYFTQALTNVVITDLRSGDKTLPHNVPNKDTEEFEPEDFEGEANVRVTSNEQPLGEERLRNGETYRYPPSQTLNELAKFNGLGELAREIDTILKSTPSPAAKSSRAAKSPPSAPKGPK
ncbi:hypothetical protein [Rhizobium aouanii]|uniref:Uncharacterized protein n=1 Tax=Rhizobium aouanii TaxID=3118145 RepID=A0ABU8CH73_9HYPH